MENDRVPVMQRNAVIALANIGTGEAMDMLRHYEDRYTGKLGEYLAWALDQSREKGEDVVGRIQSTLDRAPDP
jgi:hypothetical protein